jgi:hypothetical protein
MNPDVVVILTIIAAVGAVKILRGPLGHAFADRVRGTPPPDQGILEELEAVKRRLAEVEERLDFAERLLAQSEQAVRLPGRTDA